ncbi:MAG: hydrogenase nickel incorporation protein HypB [Cyanobacteria bacterium P01_F01_bin.42]
MHQTFSQSLELNMLHANQAGARHNQAQFDAWGALCLNLMSSPGAGKTVLLEKTLAHLSSRLKTAVIEGDMTTELDAQRLRQFDVPVVAINTGRSCHLDAQMVAGGIHTLSESHDPHQFDLIFVENVGNLVCPAEFAVGEHAKVALLSVTEGEDKPLKYPIMFREADCLLLTKVDLSPYLDISLEAIIRNVRQINTAAPIFAVSATTSEGMTAWFDWLLAAVQAKNDNLILQGS